MRHAWHNWIGSACAFLALSFCCVQGNAQRHSYGSAPPTAPPHAPIAPVAVSSGMGAIQFAAVNYGVPPPQALTRQLRADDDRTRAAALSAIGAPGQYMQRGHIVTPHSIQLEFAPLGNNEEVQALLTAELDQHIVTAVLVEDDGTWRRIATLLYATSFEDFHTTPSTFVHTARSLMQHDRYQAVFHATTIGPDGNFVENEADLRIINGKPVITMSFADAERDCGTTAPPPAHRPRPTGCTVTGRWFQADPIDPYRVFLLVSATGRVTPTEATGAFAYSRDFLYAHAHAITCQRFAYSEASLHFEPSGPPGPCPNR
jgi:hypothetical protein